MNNNIADKLLLLRHSSQQKRALSLSTERTPAKLVLFFPFVSLSLSDPLKKTWFFESFFTFKIYRKHTLITEKQVETKNRIEVWKQQFFSFSLSLSVDSFRFWRILCKARKPFESNYILRHHFETYHSAIYFHWSNIFTDKKNNLLNSKQTQGERERERERSKSQEKKRKRGNICKYWMTRIGVMKKKH